MKDYEHIRATLGQIRSDIAGDVHRFELAAFTGPTVSEWLGNLSAAVDALAAITLALVEEAHHSRPVRVDGGDMA